MVIRLLDAINLRVCLGAAKSSRKIVQSIVECSEASSKSDYHSVKGISSYAILLTHHLNSLVSSLNTNKGTSSL